MMIRFARVACIVTAATLYMVSPALSGQPKKAAAVQATEAEQELIKTIEQITDPRRLKGFRSAALAHRIANHQQALLAIDDLLQRFPNSSYKNEALIRKLATLADLALARPEYLAQFLSLTTEVSKSRPQGALASENAFHAIRAFVFAARHENMPEARRLKGTFERYEAFLDDYPNSKRVPVIWASLIRNALARGKTERAEAELKKLQKAHPNHSATRRARGELFRAGAVNQPFAFEYTAHNGEEVATKDYLGQVLVIHFWATWSARSMDGLDGLVTLRERYGERGLRLIGINVDKKRDLMEQAVESHGLSWPQYFDAKGLENDILVGAGVIELPTLLVVDRKGICRSTDPGDHLGELLEKLLAEPGP